MILCVKNCYFFIFLMITVVISSKQYRKDYIYNEKTDAFYKFHIESVSLQQAKSICNLEGASLMVPTSEHDASQVHGMFKQYPDVGDYVWIDNDGNDHESAEEQPIIDLTQAGNSYEMRFTNYANKCEVMMRNGDLKVIDCNREFPFVCKVSANDAYFDTHCMVYGKGYQYYESVGSCYKMPYVPYSWDQAYAECQNEGAHLAVLNSETERQVLQSFINSAPLVPGTQAFFFFFVGIRAEKTSFGSPVFKTVFNETLEAAGFNQWAPNEPNNALNREYCGTIFIKDARYNDVECAHLYGFICESEVKKLKLN